MSNSICTKKLLIKILIINIILISTIKLNEIIKFNFLIFEKNFLKLYSHLNLPFYKSIKQKIKIGIFAYYLKNGGRARITSLFLTNLAKIKIFEPYLFTVKNKEKNEYYIPKDIKRIVIKNFNIKKLFKIIKKKKIDIFIYQNSIDKNVEKFNKLKRNKIIFYLHQSFFYWIYSNFTVFKNIYKAYQNSEYAISLVSLENDYIFKKWGINSILMDNFITYEYNSTIQSDLTQKIILMMGRADNKLKRFQLGILSMEYIVNEDKDCQMKIISNTSNIYFLKNLVSSLILENNVKFYEYTSTPEVFFKNASLNIFPSISESFGLALCEIKIHSIPSILLGLDYISTVDKGTIIIYDDTPESIAKESLKILRNINYRKNLGKLERYSTKKFKNKNVLNKWVKLLLSVYYGKDYYEQLRRLDKKIPKKKAINFLCNQIKLLKKRKMKFQKFYLNELENFSKIIENDYL